MLLTMSRWAVVPSVASSGGVGSTGGIGGNKAQGTGGVWITTGWILGAIVYVGVVLAWHAGFTAALPSALAHAGLKGFSTQKLTWGSPIGIPFNVGVWVGPDGKFVGAALKPGAYSSKVNEDLSKSEEWLDRIWESACQGIGILVRYADDFVILCRTRAHAEEVLGVVRHWCEEAGLQLHPQKTRLVDLSERGGFDFLGYHFERTGRWPREKSLQGLEHKLHKLTRRNCGEKLSTLIEERLNPILRGWMNYFRRSTNAADFQNVDGYLRGRLRSILRKRHGLRGRGRGRDHQRWPNRYFETLGLLSLEQLWCSQRPVP